jgi:ketosteroid isomerase-like protein
VGPDLTLAAVERYITALNAGDADGIAACVDPDFHNEHTSAAGRSLRGREAYRTALRGFLGEFGNLRYEIEDLIIEGDRAAVAYRMTFRLRGAPVEIRGMFRFRVVAGLIAHRVDYWDGAEFTRQTAPST